MSLIEDRLRQDAHAPSTTPTSGAWADVVERADARQVRARMVSRVSIGVFVLVAAALAFVRPSNDVETADGPADLLDGTTEPAVLDSPVWSEASPVLALATWLIPWFGAAVAMSLVYLASPRDFRAPYLVPRIPRAVVAFSAAVVWSGTIIVMTLGGYLLIAWDPLLWTYLEARNVFVPAFVVGGFLLANYGQRSGAKGFGTLLLWFFVSGFLAGALPNDNEIFELDRGVAALGLIVAGVIPLFAIYTVNVLNFRPNWSRLSPAALRNHARPHIAGALLIAGGLLVVAIAVSQAVVFRIHLFELVPDVDGFTERVAVLGGNPLIDDQSPMVTVSTDRSGVASGPGLDAFLIDRGFERDVSSGFQDDFTRPRGDSFGTITAFTSSGPDTTESGVSFWAGEVRSVPQGEDPFAIMRTARNVGYATAVAGVLLIWSATAVNRFLIGPKPWQRRSRSREILGWCFVAGAAAIPFAWATQPAVSVAMLLTALTWWVGAHLLVPAPPKAVTEPTPDARSAPE